ncbi:TonB-dependent receptor domain-containing protein [Runella sp.]|uniref:TonB-dependent receptor domain-containing protein n=1 Tax=Runella sp. TaxID=1960881 RepID=UPI003D09A3B1
MKTFTSLVAAMLLLSTALFAQSPVRGKVSGEIREKSGKPLPFATVLLLKAKDSTLVKGAITSETGYYEVENVAEGRYLIAANMIGYQKTYSSPFDISATAAIVQVPVIQVNESTQTLQEVKVIAKKPFVEQQIDRMVVNVENSIVSAGGTALEVLEKAPGVTIDRQNDRLQLKGRQGVMVMIDGKLQQISMQDLMNMLQSMPSDNVEKIELITNPPAKYDAAGNTGLINIVLKKNKNFGTNGNYTLGAGVGVYEKLNASLGLNHRNAKINSFGNVSLFHARFKNTQSIDRTIAYKDQITYLDQNSPRVGNPQNLSFRAGLDFFVSKKTTIGVLASGFLNQFKMNGISSTDFLDKNLALTGRFATDAYNYNKLNNYTGNLNLKHDFGKGRELSADADYSYFDGNSGNDLNTIYYDPKDAITNKDIVRNVMPSTIGIAAAKVDYIQPLKKGKFEAGAKSSIVNSDNDMRFETQIDNQWILDPSRSNRFKYKENINAAYTNFSTKLDKRTQLQLGVRVEHTHSQGNSVTLNSIVDRNYVNLFPSVFVSRQLDTNNVLNVSYSRRIDRPNYRNLNPFQFFLDPLTFQQGNPNLRPQFTNSFQVTHVFKGMFSTTLGYSRINDVIADQIPKQIPAENKTYVTTENLDHQDSYNVTFSIPVTIKKWWTMQNNVSAFYNRYRSFYYGADLDLGQFGATVFVTNNFTLPKGYTAELGGFWNSPTQYNIMAVKAQGQINAGLAKSLWNRKASIRVNIQDIFFMNRFAGTVKYQDLNFTVNSRWESRQVRVSFTYRFGNQNVKAARQRSTSTEDLRNRANAGQ